MGTHLILLIVRPFLYFDPPTLLRPKPYFDVFGQTLFRSNVLHSDHNDQSTSCQCCEYDAVRGNGTARYRNFNFAVCGTACCAIVTKKLHVVIFLYSFLIYFQKSSKLKYLTLVKYLKRFGIKKKYQQLKKVQNLNKVKHFKKITRYLLLNFFGVSL